LAGGSVFRFLPLFAEEVVGFSTELAGLVVAANGLLAIAARIWWGRITEGGFSESRGLALMALGSAVCSALLLIAPQFSAALWVFAVLAAFTAGHGTSSPCSRSLGRSPWAYKARPPVWSCLGSSAACPSLGHSPAVCRHDRQLHRCLGSDHRGVAPRGCGDV